MARRSKKPDPEIAETIIGMALGLVCVLWVFGQIGIKLGLSMEMAKLLFWGCVAALGAVLGLAANGTRHIKAEAQRDRDAKKEAKEAKAEERRIKAMQRQYKLCEAEQLLKLLKKHGKGKG